MGVLQCGVFQSIWQREYGLHDRKIGVLFQISFSHGSTAVVGLCLLYEVSRAHSFRHTTLDRTPLDE
jgi:hypothetical protein